MVHAPAGAARWVRPARDEWHNLITLSSFNPSFLLLPVFLPALHMHHLSSSAVNLTSPLLLFLTWSCSSSCSPSLGALNSINHTPLCTLLCFYFRRRSDMAACRSYLRGLSICVTVLLLLFEQLSTSDGLLVLQVFGPITVVLAVLGICAAAADYKPLLLVFSALIFIEFVAVMVLASPLVQVQSQLDSAVDEVFLKATPLHAADDYIQSELKKLQASDSCCGLRSFEDWGNPLPVSCLCTPDRDWSSHPANSSLDESCVMMDADLSPPLPHTSDALWVHAKPCGAVLKSHLSFPIKLRIGIISAFATITITAIILCLSLGLENYWKKPAVEMTIDDFNRVKYQPKPSLT
uniref:Tetraspanin n=1 Tax=Oryzias latipes TaxID=8090 RepID=A0A3B3HA03_ORYLA